MPSLRELARQAAARGEVRFHAPDGPCRQHDGWYYTATRRCCRCTAEAKNPVARAAYWRRVGEKYNRAKRMARRGMGTGSREK